MMFIQFLCDPCRHGSISIGMEILEKKQIQGKMAISLLDILSQEGNTNILVWLSERRQNPLIHRKSLAFVLRPLFQDPLCIPSWPVVFSCQINNFPECQHQTGSFCNCDEVTDLFMVLSGYRQHQGHCENQRSSSSLRQTALSIPDLSLLSSSSSVSHEIHTSTPIVESLALPGNSCVLDTQIPKNLVGAHILFSQLSHVISILNNVMSATVNVVHPEVCLQSKCVPGNSLSGTD